jgi:hypothetical protein
MRFEEFSFGSIRIDGTTDGHGVVIDRGHIHKRNEKPSKKCRDTFGLRPRSLLLKAIRIFAGRGGRDLQYE